MLSRSIPAHMGCIRRRPLIALFVQAAFAWRAPLLHRFTRLTNRSRSPQQSTACLMQRRTIGPQRRSVGPAPAAASSIRPTTTTPASATAAGGSKPPPPAAASTTAAGAAATALLRWRPPTPARARQWCVVARRGRGLLAACLCYLDRFNRSTPPLPPTFYPHTRRVDAAAHQGLQGLYDSLALSRTADFFLHSAVVRENSLNVRMSVWGGGEEAIDPHPTPPHTRVYVDNKAGEAGSLRSTHQPPFPHTPLPHPSTHYSVPRSERRAAARVPLHLPRGAGPLDRMAGPPAVRPPGGEVGDRLSVGVYISVCVCERERNLGGWVVGFMGMWITD